MVTRMSNQIFFICGVISNNLGFQCKSLSTNRLPGDPPRYLDRFDPKKMNQGTTYLITREIIDNNAFAIFSVMRPVNPNDQLTNRGSYIAVGVLNQSPITLNDAIFTYEVIAEIHGMLNAFRDERNAFHAEFHLDDFNFDFSALHKRNASYLIDSLYFSTQNQNDLANANIGNFKDIAYNDVSITDMQYSLHCIQKAPFEKIKDQNEMLRKQTEIIKIYNNQIKQLEDKITKRDNSIKHLKNIIREKNIHSRQSNLNIPSRNINELDIIDVNKDQNTQQKKEHQAQKFKFENLKENQPTFAKSGSWMDNPIRRRGFTKSLPERLQLNQSKYHNEKVAKREILIRNIINALSIILVTLLLLLIIFFITRWLNYSTYNTNQTTSVNTDTNNNKPNNPATNYQNNKKDHEADISERRRDALNE